MLLSLNITQSVMLKHLPKYPCRLLVFCLILFVATIAYPQTLNTYTAEQFMTNLIASERKINDVQLHMRCTVPDMNDKLFYDFDWGYEGGKEFYTGQKYRLYKNLEAPDSSGVHTETKAFDGEKAYFLRLHSDNKPTGYVDSLDPEEFRGIVTPTTLLGFDAKEMSRMSLGEALAQAESVSVSKECEIIDGHPCHVIQAINVEMDPDTKWSYDVRVWIDTQRDFRPLKIVKYFGFGGTNTWKLPSRVIEHIRLAQINNIWFPIEGEATTFTITDMRPPERMTKQQLDKLTVEERRREAVFTIEPMVPTRRLTIAGETIRINKGIPPDRFIINFPVGCTVWDQFQQLAYTIGGRDEDLLESLHKESIEHGLTKDTHINTTSNIPQKAVPQQHHSEPDEGKAGISWKNTSSTGIPRPRLTIYLAPAIFLLVVFLASVYLFETKRNTKRNTK